MKQDRRTTNAAPLSREPHCVVPAARAIAGLNDQASAQPWSERQLEIVPPRDGAGIDRRGFLQLLLGAAGAALCPTSLATRPSRALKLHHCVTDESLTVEFWRSGEGYQTDALEQINWLLRDHHKDQVKRIDPQLLELLWTLQARLAPGRTIEVISGYRSPATNERLRRRSKRVAKNSYHLKGKAVDIRIPGCSTARLRQASLGLKAGGVGAYAKSRFVHVDTGPVRTWQGV